MKILLRWSRGSKRERFGVVFDIEVELVNRIDRTDSPSGFVSFHGLDLGPPEWVYGNPVLEEPSDPRKVILFALVDAWMDGVMHENHPDLVLSDQLVHLFPTLPDHAGSVCIDHDGIRIVENGFVLRPPRMNEGLNGHFFLGVEVFGQQMRSGFELMVSDATATAVKKDDFGRMSGDEGERERERQKNKGFESLIAVMEGWARVRKIIPT